jgi:AraC-like DNA-binding protein
MSLYGAQRVLLAGLADVGLDAGSLCVRAGVDPRLLDTPLEGPSAPLGRGVLARILAAAEAVSGDALLGLHIGERAPERGALGYLARAQRTLGDALRALERFAANWWENAGAVRVEARGAASFVDLGLRAGASRHATEYLIARIARGLARSGVQPLEARLAHAAGGDAREYARVLDCPVRFAQAETGVLLRASDLARPLRTANPEAAALLASALALRPLPRARPLAERLAAAVERALERGEAPQREALARELGMSGRTLARRLAEQGLGFREQIEQVRRALAARLLAQDALDLEEVAARVGFADRAAFGRAFRRWFGESPSAWRARQRAA